jgi:hypothetical protein
MKLSDLNPRENNVNLGLKPPASDPSKHIPTGEMQTRPDDEDNELPGIDDKENELDKSLDNAELADNMADNMAPFKTSRKVHSNLSRTPNISNIV